MAQASACKVLPHEIIFSMLFFGKCNAYSKTYDVGTYNAENQVERLLSLSIQEPKIVIIHKSKTVYNHEDY